METKVMMTCLPVFHGFAQDGSEHYRAIFIQHCCFNYLASGFSVIATIYLSTSISQDVRVFEVEDQKYSKNPFTEAVCL